MFLTAVLFVISFAQRARPDSNSGSSNNGELNGAILAIGDSWIDSEFELGTLSQNCASKTVINLGASGSTAQQWLNGDINLAEARDEDVTFTHAYVSLGGNDQMGAGCRTSALTSIASDLTAINNQVRSIYGQSIQIVMTGYGMGPDPATDGCDDDTLRQFQVMISQVAQETGATFVDVRNLFKRNPSDELGQSQYFVDAIHLNRAGYNRMWQLPALQSAFNCGGSSDGGNNIGGGSGGEQPSDSNDGENSSSDPQNDEEESTSNESDITQDASFYASQTESCPTGSYIIDEETCVAAARSLGLAEELTRSFNNHMRTRGCYVKNNKVYFNENPTLTSNRSRRNSICCSSDNCSSDAEDEEEYDEETEYEEEEAEPTVFVSENGSCPPTSNYVSKLADCREASNSLGFSRVKSFRNPNRLRGCYVFRNRAWFNRDTTAVEQPNQTNRKSVCVNFA
jgi:lysophospholipase L1-like esterase